MTPDSYQFLPSVIIICITSPLKKCKFTECRYCLFTINNLHLCVSRYYLKTVSKKNSLNLHITSLLFYTIIPISTNKEQRLRLRKIRKLSYGRTGIGQVYLNKSTSLYLQGFKLTRMIFYS